MGIFDGRGRAGGARRWPLAVLATALVAAACGGRSPTTARVATGGAGGSGAAGAAGAATDPSLPPGPPTTVIPAPAGQQPPAPVPAAARLGTWQRLDAGPLVTRGEPTAVWTGTDVVVIGGLLIDRYQVVVDGAAYRPATGQWRTIAPRPDPQRIFTGVWTGRAMIVWGGGGTSINPNDPLGDGDAYDPATDRWSRIAANPMRFPATPPIAAWTGSRVLLWPGTIGMPASAAPGALYDPDANSWSTIPPVGLPGVLSVGAGVWTGQRWAALTLGSTGKGGPAVQSLALFDPGSGTWKAAAAPPSNLTGSPPRPAWTGREVLVIGDTATLAYNPATDQWRNAPSPDLSQFPGIFRTVSLADGRVVAAVGQPATFLDVYDPSTDRWQPTGPPPGPLPAVSDAGFTSTGNAVFLFGITTDGTIVKAGEPNAAWMWSPR